MEARGTVDRDRESSLLWQSRPLLRPQSPKVTADELDRRIEAFIEDFRAVLAAMPEEDFNRNKAAGVAVGAALALRLPQQC